MRPTKQEGYVREETSNPIGVCVILKGVTRFGTAKNKIMYRLLKMNRILTGRS